MDDIIFNGRMHGKRNIHDTHMLEAIEHHLDELGVPATNEIGMHNVLARFIMLRADFEHMRDALMAIQELEHVVLDEAREIAFNTLESLAAKSTDQKKK